MSYLATVLIRWGWREASAPEDLGRPPYKRFLFYFVTAAILAFFYGTSWINSFFRMETLRIEYLAPFMLFALVIIFAARMLHYYLIGKLNFIPYLVSALFLFPTAGWFSYPQADRLAFLDSSKKDSALNKISDERRGSVRLDLNGEVRTCMVLDFNNSITTPARIPPHGRLIFGLGVAKDADARSEALIRVMVKTRSGSVGKAGEFRLKRNHSHWRDFAVDLGAHAGQPVKVVIEAFDAPGKISSESAEKRIYVSSPRIVSFDPDDPPPNVVLIVVDTLRNDAVFPGSGKPSAAPNIRELASRGTRFERHYAQSSWTLPSTASLLTSKMPIQTGLMSSGMIDLDRSHLTIAEVLQKEGWKTAAFSCNHLVLADNNFDQGFDSFKAVFSPLLYCNKVAERMNREVMKWLDRNGDSPFFLYLTYIDPHDPYLPPSDFINRSSDFEISPSGLARALYNWGPFLKPDFEAGLSEQFRALYDQEVNYTDHCVGELINRLQRDGRLENTLVIITSDHGEEFLEHGLFMHGTSLYDEVVHVPMIVMDGRDQSKGEVYKGITSHVDIFPTITDYLGIETPAGLLGGSLMPLMDGHQRHGRDNSAMVELPVVLFYDHFDGAHREGLKDMYQRAIIRDDLKLIEQTNRKNGAVNAVGFDLAADPGEARPIHPAGKPEFAEMRAEMDEFFEVLPDKKKMEDADHHSPENEQLLRSLGYLR